MQFDRYVYRFMYLYTCVTYSPRICLHILLFNCRWFYYGVLSTLMNFNIAIVYLFYFLFSDWFSLFLLLYFLSHSLRQQQSSTAAGRLASKGKFYNIMLIFYLPLLWPVKLTKWLTCHEGQRERGCLTDYRLDLWLVKDSVYLSCIACKWVFFRQLRIEFVVFVFCRFRFRL